MTVSLTTLVGPCSEVVGSGHVTNRPFFLPVRLGLPVYRSLFVVPWLWLVVVQVPCRTVSSMVVSDV